MAKRKSISQPRKSANRQAYEKRVKSIKKQLKYYERRGYVVDVSQVLDINPPRVTQKKLKEVQQLKPKQILEKYGEYGGAETYGEVVPASEGFALEKQARKEAKAKQKDERLVKEFTPKTDHDKKPQPVERSYADEFNNLTVLIDTLEDVAVRNVINKEIQHMMETNGLYETVEQLGRAMAETNLGGALRELHYERETIYAEVHALLNFTSEYFERPNEDMAIIEEAIDESDSYWEDSEGNPFI